MQPLSRRPMHPRQLFLLLLLYRAQQSVHVWIVLRLLLAALLWRRLRLLLRLRAAILLRSAAAALLFLHRLLATQGDLQIAFRAGVIRPNPQRVAVVVDRVVERIRRKRAVAAIE